MNALAIWGATGFIGSALGAAAEAQGWQVRRLPRQPGPADLAGAAVACHCAGKAGDADAAGYAEAAERFARHCAEAGVGRLAYVSTVAVYGPRFEGEVGIDTPPQPADSYAQSRLDAERRLAGALAGTGTAPIIVRVPMVVGRGMPGTVLARFSRAVRRGLFLHPGPAQATLACIGIGRLARILVELGGRPAPEPLLQFSDHVPWVEIARLAGLRHGRQVRRVQLPSVGGKLRVLSSTVRYADDTARLFAGTPLPATLEDLEAALDA